MKSRSLRTMLMTSAFALALSPAIGAQVQPARTAPAATVVSLERCLELAAANNSALRIEELKSGLGRTRLVEAREQYLPSVQVQAGASLLSPLEASSINVNLGTLGTKTISFGTPLSDAINFKLAVAQPLFTGFRIESGIAQADALYEAGLSDLEKTRLDLRLGVERAYWSLARAAEVARVMTENVGQVEAHLADARNLAAQGLLTANEVLKIDIQLTDARLAVLDAENAVESARVQLNILVGLPWDAATTAERIDPDEAVVPPASAADLIEEAVAKRPELSSARYRVKAAEAAVEAAKSSLYPSVSLTGDYTYADPNQRVFPQKDAFTGTWSIGLMASVDVGRYPLSLEQAKDAGNQADQGRLSLVQLRDSIVSEVVQARLALLLAIEESASAKKVVAQAEENDRISGERFREGLALSSERIDSQTTLVRARIQYAQSAIGRRAATAALNRAVGR
jgi:outer membrane protein